MSKNCDSCNHLNNSSNHILTTNHWAVALAPDQGYLGRCYVTLRKHKSELSSLTAEEWTEFSVIVKQLEQACKKAFGATPFNWACMMNNAYKVEHAEPHVHWHFRPRHAQPVEINGVTFDDPLYSHHYDRDQRWNADNETFKVILEKIRSNI